MRKIQKYAFFKQGYEVSESTPSIFSGEKRYHLNTNLWWCDLRCVIYPPPFLFRETDKRKMSPKNAI